MKRALLCGVLGVATVGYFTFFGHVTFASKIFGFDFVAFYCAGEAVNHKADPYLTEPLRTCENRVGPSFRRGGVVALPAPLPAYDLSIFRLAAQVPFAIAAWLWFAIICGACIASICLVVRLTSLSPLLVTAGMSFPLLSCAYYGQIAPIAIFGILVAARAFATSSPWLAFSGMLLAASEPHLGAFAIGGLLLWGSPPVRAATGIAIAILAAVWFSTLPLRQNVEYVVAVLPLHARSELNFPRQFGLPNVLHGFGVREELAVHVSEYAFLAALLFGVAAVPGLRRRLSPELAILAPTAALLLVAPFLHITQIAMAAPIALLLWAKTKRHDAAIAAILLAMPWIEFARIYTFAPLVVAGLAFLGYRLLRIRPTYGLALGALAAALCTLSYFELVKAPHRTLLATNASPTSLAEASWREYIDLNRDQLRWIILLARVPTYAGLVFLLWSTVAAANGSSSVRTPRRIPRLIQTRATM